MDIVINQVNYALPARSFVIDYSVSQKRQLPVVKEFVLRFVYSLQNCSSENIREFFGFSVSEMSSVLADLEEEKLIKWVDDELTLTNYALDRFTEAGGGNNTPRFYEIRDQVDIVSFDLMTYRLITERLSGKPSYANIELKLDTECFNDISGKAMAAFDRQFTDFLEKAKKVDTYQEYRELYKINSISTQSDRMLPIRVNWVVDTEESLDPIPEFADDILHDWDDDGSIIGAIAQLLTSGAGVTQEQKVKLREYLKLSFDPWVSDFLEGEGVNLSGLINSYRIKHGILDPKTSMVFGNLYTSENRRKMESLLSSSFDPTSKWDCKGAIWVSSPEDKTWGRGDDIHELASQINRRIDSRYNPGKLVHCMSVDSIQEARELNGIYYSPATKLQGVSNDFGNGSIEVVLVPNVFVATIFHYRPPGYGRLTFPFGYMSTDQRYVKAVQNGVHNWALQESNFNSYFQTQTERSRGSSNGTLIKAFE
jgi:hypothetical protein